MKSLNELIRVFLDFDSEIKLKNEKNLINIIIEIYAVCINAAYNKIKVMRHSSVKHY